MSKAQQQIEAMQALTQQAAAWLVGLNRSTFRDAGTPRNKDGSYNAADIYAWSQKTATPDSDPLLSGSDSPNLERYRAAKAEAAEIDLAERKGQLVHIDELTDWWAVEVAGPIRKAIDMLERKHGPDAAAIVNNAIEVAANRVDERGDNQT